MKAPPNPSLNTDRPTAALLDSPRAPAATQRGQTPMDMKLSPPDLELYRAVDEVLYYLWDPIGVSSIPEARDEYHGYLPHIFGMVHRGEDEAAIAAYLSEVIAERMGLSADQKPTNTSLKCCSYGGMPLRANRLNARFDRGCPTGGDVRCRPAPQAQRFRCRRWFDANIHASTSVWNFCRVRSARPGCTRSVTWPWRDR